MFKTYIYQNLIKYIPIQFRIVYDKLNVYLFISTISLLLTWHDVYIIKIFLVKIDNI